MIADTNFVSEILKERARGRRGPAMDFLATHRKEPLCTCIITVGELAPWFGRSAEIWPALRRWPIFRLHDGIVNAAADLDRQLTREGRRLGENDNWIAGFALYYRVPILSRDEDFDGIPALRRVKY